MIGLMCDKFRMSVDLPAGENGLKRVIPLAYCLTGTVCLPGGMYEDYFIWIEGEKIKRIGPVDQLPASFYGEVYSYPKTYSIVPGFIDMHIHGTSGADVMDGTEEAFLTIARNIVKEGTTAFLATTVTQSVNAIEFVLKNAGMYIQSPTNTPGQAEMIGIHLEGPFIHPKRKGAQPEEYILEPNIKLFKMWQQLSGKNIRLVTVAPELKNGYEFIKYVTDHGVIASIGHSDANYPDVKAAVEAEQAMSPIYLTV